MEKWRSRGEKTTFLGNDGDVVRIWCVRIDWDTPSSIRRLWGLREWLTYSSKTNVDRSLEDRDKQNKKREKRTKVYVAKQALDVDVNNGHCFGAEVLAGSWRVSTAIKKGAEKGRRHREKASVRAYHRQLTTAERVGE